MESGPQEGGFDLEGGTLWLTLSTGALLPAGLDHRARGLRRLLLRGGVCLPSELLHERHQPRHCADTGECGLPALRGAVGGWGTDLPRAPPSWGQSRSLPRATS